MAGPKQPTTAPPPFDPEAYARDSETELRTGSDFKLTAEFRAPPLNKRVLLAVPLADLAWFDLSPQAQALIERIDGTRTLMELMEVDASPEALRAIAELYEAKVLLFE